jgi:hypothetical protein
MFFWTPYDFLILPAVILSIWAQFRVKGTFNRWSEMRTASGMSGYEAARRMLDRNGLHDIPVDLGRLGRLPRSRPCDSTQTALSDARPAPPDIPGRQFRFGRRPFYVPCRIAVPRNQPDRSRHPVLFGRRRVPARDAARRVQRQQPRARYYGR